MPVGLLDHRQLGDAVALHQVDRLADGLAGLDRDELRQFLLVRRHDLADAHGAEPGQVSVLAHPLVVEELAEVVAPRVREQDDDDVPRLALARDLHRGVKREP